MIRTRLTRTLVPMIVLLALSSQVTPALSSVLTDKRNQLNSIQSDLNSTRQKIDSAKTRQLSLSKQIEETDRRISDIQEEIEKLGKDLSEVNGQRTQTEVRLAELQAQLVSTQKELDQAKAELATQTGVLNRRVINVYKSGSTGYLQVILDSSDFADLLNRLSFLQLIVEQDARLLEKIRRTKEIIEAKRLAIEEDRRKVNEQRLVLLVQEQKIAALKEQEEDKKKAEQTELDNQEKLLAQARKDRQTYEHAEELLVSASAQIARDIRRLEEEARRRVLRGSRGRTHTATGAQRISASGFMWPVDGDVTSPFGMRRHPILGDYRMHTGVDIGVPSGRTIYAAQSGTVLLADWTRGYGLTVIIDHGNSLSTLYAHTSRVLVSSGDYVERGAAIAEVGSTGLSTGPHLHFEVRVNGEPQNPMNWY